MKGMAGVCIIDGVAEQAPFEEVLGAPGGRESGQYS